MSTDAEMKPPVAEAVGELKIDEPTLPRAGVADGLAHGSVTHAAVTDADETTIFEIPRLARALRHRDFRLFWTGNFLSNIGTWMQNIAQGWLVLQLTNSAFWLGVVGFAASIPILLFALIGGVIADHMNKRKLLMVTQSAMMVFAFIMAIFVRKKGIAEAVIRIAAELAGDRPVIVAIVLMLVCA
ncbi:MAG: MFS transporter, partial [Terriglobales bacterium]